MGAAPLVLTWALATLPLALGWWSAGGSVLAGAQQLAPVLLPWVFVAGLPRRAERAPAPAALLLAFAAPPVALAAGLDLAGGVEAAAVATSAGVGGTVLLLLAWAAERALQGGPRSARAYATAWVACVPGAAAVAFVHAQAALPAPGGTSSGGWVDGLGPLALVHALARGAAPSPAAWALAACALAAPLVLGASAAGSARRGELGP